MATYTDNYNLEKPAQSDLYNIDVFNENADKVDEALGDKAENQSLAPIESSATASRNYSVGQQFVYNGLLYEATSAIASGGTITPGTNCARTTVAEELSALNDSLTHYNRTGEMTMEVSQYNSRYLAVFQRIVIFEIVLPSFTAGNLKIAVLPTTVRPTMQVSLSVSTELSADRAGHQEAFVNTAGEVYVHRERNSTGKISITGCWYLP